MKPKLFIGSSSESLFIARALVPHLSGAFEIKLWEGAFQANEFFLERLQKELFLTDYALFIAAPEDRLHKRGLQLHVTRDNVIFELGMFIGALGLRKAYFLVADLVVAGEKLVLELPSDLQGINSLRMTLDADNVGKIRAGKRNLDIIAAQAPALLRLMAPGIAELQLNLLPSTSLAIGYYRNFILQACQELADQRQLTLNGNMYDLSKDNYDFYIIIPDKGADASHEAYQKFVRRHALQQTEIRPRRTGARPFPFFISADTKEGRLQLYDLPTTLRASRETIKLVMPSNTTRLELEMLEIKEIRNFRRTIEFLLKEPESDSFCDNIHLLSASDLINSL